MLIHVSASCIFSLKLSIPFLEDEKFYLSTTPSLPQLYTYTHPLNLVRVKFRIMVLVFRTESSILWLLFFFWYNILFYFGLIFISFKFDEFYMYSLLIQSQSLLLLYNKPLIIFKHVRPSPNFLFLEKINFPGNLWPATIWTGSSPCTPLVLDSVFTIILRFPSSIYFAGSI